MFVKRNILLTQHVELSPEAACCSTGVGSKNHAHRCRPSPRSRDRYSTSPTSPIVEVRLVFLSSSIVIIIITVAAIVIIICVTFVTKSIIIRRLRFIVPRPASSQATYSPSASKEFNDISVAKTKNREEACMQLKTHWHLP